ncbi:hypothetical protein FQZ97_1045930 [compost metagenome]
MAQEEGVLGHRVAVDGDREHIGSLIEDGLRAVAVVVVHIQHRHLRVARIAQRLRGDGRVVQEAVTAQKVGTRMVARRARECKRTARTR